MLMLFHAIFTPFLMLLSFSIVYAALLLIDAAITPILRHY